MAKYQLTNFVDRDSQYPNRRKLKDIVTMEEKVFDVFREEGEITQEGTPWDAATMNAFDQKISQQFNYVEFTPDIYVAYKNDNSDTWGYSSIGSAQTPSAKYAFCVCVGSLAFLHIVIHRYHNSANGSHGDNSFLMLGPLPSSICPKINYRQGGTFPEFCKFNWVNNKPSGENLITERITGFTNPPYPDNSNVYRNMIGIYHNNGAAIFTGDAIRNFSVDLTLDMVYKYD